MEIVDTLWKWIWMSQITQTRKNVYARGDFDNKGMQPSVQI